MIKSISLTNFRKHTSTVLNFENGLQVIRGMNEIGKSTVFEAVAYALFGAKALRNSFDDTVTWGEKPASLKVVSVLCLGGVNYTFSRSKGGAECIYGDKMVTGQTEVTEFAANLLGVDAPTAAKLMFAHQGSLRGALDTGPKATSEMIESLADFDLFEVIIEKMQDKLTLGNTGPAEARIAEAQESLEALVVGSAPDAAAHKKAVSLLQAEFDLGSKWIYEIGEPAYQAAKSTLDRATFQKQQHEAAGARFYAARTQYELQVDQLAKATSSASAAPNPEVLKVLQSDLAKAEEHDRLVAIYAEGSKLAAAYKGDIWEGTVATLKDEITDSEACKTEVMVKIASLRGDIREAAAKMVTSSHCGFCNQDVSQFPEVASSNSKFKEIIEQSTYQMGRCEVGQGEIESALQDLRKVERDSLPIITFLNNNAKHYEINNEFVPPAFTWKGEIPSAIPDLDAIKDRIKALEDRIKAADQAAARVVVLTESVEFSKNNLGVLQRELENTPAPANLEELDRACIDTGNARVMRQGKIAECEREMQTLKTQFDTALAEYKHSQARRAEAAARLVLAKTELSDLNFNNTLLKKIRAARPIISDKLWNSVLAAVSTMFSQMRGEQSVVKKGKDGFTINGASFTSLSGSTLDLLGLAIRIALVKTFIPRCSFLILDEPFSACDEERSSRMLGFIAAAGFDQTIVITHEENSEAVADNLVYL